VASGTQEDFYRCLQTIVRVIWTKIAGRAPQVMQRHCGRDRLPNKICRSRSFRPCRRARLAWRSLHAD
jgi:hypothetical protein